MGDPRVLGHRGIITKQNQDLDRPLDPIRMSLHIPGIIVVGRRSSKKQQTKTETFDTLKHHEDMTKHMILNTENV